MAVNSCAPLPTTIAVTTIATITVTTITVLVSVVHGLHGMWCKARVAAKAAVVQRLIVGQTAGGSNVAAAVVTAAAAGEAVQGLFKRCELGACVGVEGRVGEAEANEVLALAQEGTAGDGVVLQRGLHHTCANEPHILVRGQDVVGTEERDVAQKGVDSALELALLHTQAAQVLHVVCHADGRSQLDRAPFHRAVEGLVSILPASNQRR